MDDLTIAILAGGESRRMGADKWRMPLHGKPLIDHVLDRTRSLQPAEVIILCRDPRELAARDAAITRDLIPAQGPLGGLYTALSLAKTDLVALLGCDMPFVNPALLAHLAEIQRAHPEFEAVVPRRQGRPQPLHAVYHRAALKQVESSVSAAHLRMIDLLDKLNTHCIDEAAYDAIEPTGLAFVSLNTPDDLRTAGENPAGLLNPSQP